MIALTTGQAVAALIVVAFAWIGQTDRIVNRIVDGFVQSGRATDLDRDAHARVLRTVAIGGMPIGVFAFGYGLANLLFK
jgi:hypothetical protein